MFELICRQAQRIQEHRHLKKGARARQRAISRAACSMSLEPLEGRQLLSAAHHGHHGHALHTILFSQAPTSVQTGLDTDATNHSLADPTDSTQVILGNSNGVETYSVVISSTGATTRLTVDQDGNEITAPTTSTTTFGDLGTSDSAASTEISAIATAKNLTGLSSTTNVNVVTQSDGTVTYSVRLKRSATSKHRARKMTVSVDASGDPVGNQDLPFSVIPTTIQNGLNANAPTGATALDSTSTQDVSVQTIDGVTLYTTSYTFGSTTSQVTVKKDGSVGTLPTHTTTTYADLTTSDSTAATEMQTLATAEGAGTIDTTTSVDVYTEANGTILYSVSVAATDSTTSTTFNLTITVDAAGNPTTLPGRRFGDGFGGGGFDHRFFGDPGDGASPGDQTGGGGGGGGGCMGGPGSSGSSGSNSGSNNTGTTTSARPFGFFGGRFF